MTPQSEQSDIQSNRAGKDCFPQPIGPVVSETVDALDVPTGNSSRPSASVGLPEPQTCARCGETYVRRFVGPQCWECDDRDRQAASLCNQRLRMCGVPSRHTAFGTWSALAGSPDYMRALEALRKFTAKGNSVALVVGERGTGKTQALAVAVAETISAGREARYVTALELLADLKDRFGGDRSAELAWLRDWVAPHLLTIDEIGERMDSEHTRLSLTALVDKRYSMKKPTILAGNLTEPGIVACVGASIADRANEGGGVILFAGWPSFRDGRCSTSGCVVDLPQ